MTQSILLDVHTHLIPVLAEELARFPGVSFDQDAAVMTIDGHRVGVNALFDPAALIAWMDDNHIVRGWISAPPPTYRQHLRGEQSRAWTDYLNAGLVAIAAGHPSRLDALLHLPTEEPLVAEAVARAAIAQGRARFAMATGTGDDRVLSDAQFSPLWGVLDAARAFVLFHPGECDDARLEKFYLGNLLGNPYETGVAIAHLVLGGVLERHPNLTLCFAHGGGVAMAVGGRLQRGFDTDRPGIDKTLASPRAQLRRIQVDCIVHGAAETALLEAVFGEDRVVFGSDWPFPMGIASAQAQLADLPERTRARILAQNLARLMAAEP